MQLTRAADYALRAMIHMAGLPAGHRVSTSELAEAAEVSETFLSKVLQKLVTRGLVVSFRGQGGGLQLALPASQISVLDVVESIEGPIALNCCVNPIEGCKRSPWCAAHAVWFEAQNRVRETLEAAKLDRLALESATARLHLNDARVEWASN